MTEEEKDRETARVAEDREGRSPVTRAIARALWLTDSEAIYARRVSAIIGALDLAGFAIVPREEKDAPPPWNDIDRARRIAAQLQIPMNREPYERVIAYLLSELAAVRSEARAAVLAERDARQQRVASWCAAAFGADHAASLPQRGVRLLEEAIEAYQACGGDLAMAHKLLDFVFARPAGALGQELGGVGITLLALASAAGVSADAEEQREFDRVLAKPLAHFHARNQAKNAAGFDALAYPSLPPPPSQGEGKE